MSYFMVPLGLYQATRKENLAIKIFLRYSPATSVGGNVDTKIWITNYETRRRKRGTIVSGR